MFKAVIWGVVLVLLGEALGAYIVVTTGAIPAAADNIQPLPLEHWAARTSLRTTLNRDAPKGPNPITLSDANLLTGVQLFVTHCAICHGTAQGDAAPSAIAKGEYPAPPQLASAGVEDDPMGWDFWKIKHGIRWTAMPAWRYELNDQQIWTLALFLKHMDKLPPAVQQAWQRMGSRTPAPTDATPTP